MFQSHSTEEQLYDRILKQDIDYLKNRAVKVMGLISEDLSLIDPIIAISYASDDAVKTGVTITAQKKNLLQWLISTIKAIFLEIILAIPRIIYNAIMILVGKGNYVSSAVFFEGNEGKIRCSLVSFCIISFAEQQVVSYKCNFDIALGLILEECAREVFYRDIDSVSYGTETLHVTLANGTVTRSPSVNMCLAIASEKNIEATIYGGLDVLKHEFMAMKSLVRSKKEELS